MNLYREVALSSNKVGDPGLAGSKPKLQTASFQGTNRFYSKTEVTWGETAVHLLKKILGKPRVLEIEQRSVVNQVIVNRDARHVRL